MFRVSQSYPKESSSFFKGCVTAPAECFLLSATSAWSMTIYTCPASEITLTWSSSAHTALKTRSWQWVSAGLSRFVVLRCLLQLAQIPSNACLCNPDTCVISTSLPVRQVSVPAVSQARLQLATNQHLPSGSTCRKPEMDFQSSRVVGLMLSGLVVHEVIIEVPGTKSWILQRTNKHKPSKTTKMAKLAEYFCAKSREQTGSRSLQGPGVSSTYRAELLKIEKSNKTLKQTESL